MQFRDVPLSRSGSPLPFTSCRIPIPFNIIEQDPKHRDRVPARFNVCPAGSQPEAIRTLTEGSVGEQYQTLLGVTGSGKTFTMANVIAAAEKPTLVLAHNKTLAAQLYQEFCDFFPNNRVEYFVSYYDYYQPESYIPSKDQYIEKDSAINPKIEMLRLSATASLSLPGGRDRGGLRLVYLRSW